MFGVANYFSVNPSKISLTISNLAANEYSTAISIIDDSNLIMAITTLDYKNIDLNQNMVVTLNVV